MKNNTKKSILQKIIFALLLIVLVFNFISPQIALAKDDEVDNGIVRFFIKRNSTIICIIRRCNNGGFK
ncbi:MAG: hypothetical protein ACLTKT_07540 [Clostridia bacterium]|nr:hypothetical protein [Clostridium sp.]